jgi:hypothetical protein
MAKKRLSSGGLVRIDRVATSETVAPAPSRKTTRLSVNNVNASDPTLDV